MGEEVEFQITATCPCGAGVSLLDEGDDVWSGKCSLCSTEIVCSAGPAEIRGG